MSNCNFPRFVNSLLKLWSSPACFQFQRGAEAELVLFEKYKHEKCTNIQHLRNENSCIWLHRLIVTNFKFQRGAKHTLMENVFSQLPVLMKVCLWDGGLWWWFEYNLWWWFEYNHWWWFEYHLWRWSLMVVWMYSIIVLLGFHRWLRFQIGENGRQEIQPENVFLFLFGGEIII